MVITLDVKRVCRMLLLAAAVAGCQRSQPPSPSPPGETQPYSTSFSASGWMYHLRPLKPDAAADAGKAREIWRDLFPGMAKDPKTRELLKHLHADLPVDFVVLDAKQAADKTVLLAPPPDGSAFAMRVADLSQTEEKLKGDAVPVRVIAYSHVVLIKNSLAAPDLGALAEDWKKEPLPGGPLNLAMDEYVLRHSPGWTVLGGPVAQDVKLPASVEEHRRKIDREVKEYTDHARAYYGAICKR
jgi:hypothetical protein